MPIDLAIDYNSGDLIFAPNYDLETREGQDTIEQRIRVRIKVIAGSYDYDPTLGSAVREAMRMPTDMAMQMIPMFVKEALEPMTDIQVQDVVCAINPLSAVSIDVTVSYSMVNDPSTILTTTISSITSIAEGVS